MKVIDMHCDTIYRLYQEDGCSKEDGLQKNTIHIDLNKMKDGDYLLQNFALFVDLEEAENPFETAMGMAARYDSELQKNKEVIAPVYQFEDIEKNRQSGKMSSMLTLEEGGILKGKMEFLQIFYRLGVRMIGLTWNHENEIGSPNLIYEEGQAIPKFTERNSKGLSPFGIEVVQRMETMGMIVDVSHLSDGGFHDVVMHTKQPFVASHSNAAAVCNMSRNLTDDMIRILAERGGVMGLNFCSAFLAAEQTADSHQQDTGMIADMVRHIKHIRNVGGIDVCALGSDFDGIPGNPEIADASQMQKLAEALRKEQFTETEIEKLYYKNVLRVYKEVLR